MEISKIKGLFGFQPYEFKGLLFGETLIRGYRYRNKKINELLEYIDGEYLYEDENVVFNSPTEINENGIFFFRLKKKFLIHENDFFKFYTNFNFMESSENVDVIMIQVEVKSQNNVFYTWIYSTIDFTIETLEKISKDEFYNYYPYDLSFYFTAYYGYKKLTKENILQKLSAIKDINGLPSNVISREIFL